MGDKAYTAARQKPSRAGRNSCHSPRELVTEQTPPNTTMASSRFGCFAAVLLAGLQFPRFKRQIFVSETSIRSRNFSGRTSKSLIISPWGKLKQNAGRITAGPCRTKRQAKLHTCALLLSSTSSSRLSTEIPVSSVTSFLHAYCGNTGHISQRIDLPGPPLYFCSQADCKS